MNKLNYEVRISVYRDRDSGGIEIVVEDESGSGVRLCGPKFCGDDRFLGCVRLKQQDADEIRFYLDRAFPMKEELT